MALTRMDVSAASSKIVSTNLSHAHGTYSNALPSTYMNIHEHSRNIHEHTWTFTEQYIKCMHWHRTSYMFTRGYHVLKRYDATSDSSWIPRQRARIFLTWSYYILISKIGDNDYNGLQWHQLRLKMTSHGRPARICWTIRPVNKLNGIDWLTDWTDLSVFE